MDRCNEIDIRTDSKRVFRKSIIDSQLRPIRMLTVNVRIVFHNFRLKKEKTHINQVNEEYDEMKRVFAKFILRVEASFYIKEQQRAISKIQRLGKIG